MGCLTRSSKRMLEGTSTVATEKAAKRFFSLMHSTAQSKNPVIVSVRPGSGCSTFPSRKPGLNALSGVSEQSKDRTIKCAVLPLIVCTIDLTCQATTKTLFSSAHTCQNLCSFKLSSHPTFIFPQRTPSQSCASEPLYTYIEALLPARDIYSCRLLTAFKSYHHLQRVFTPAWKAITTTTKLFHYFHRDIILANIFCRIFYSKSTPISTSQEENSSSFPSSTRRYIPPT